MASRKRGKILHSDARAIVYNVIKYFDEEKNLERYHPLKYSAARAVMATNLSMATISKIKKEGKLAEQANTKIRTPSKGKKGKNNTRVPMDSSDICAIRNIVASIYDVRKEVPTLNKIQVAARADLNYKGSKTTLRKILKEKLGFKFKKCRQNRMVLIERDNIKAWRVKYLRRLRQNDAMGAEKKKVVYMDESWIHAHYPLSTDKGVRKNDSPGQRWVMVHAGSEDGFVEGAGLLFKDKSKKGDYHDEMNSNNFTKYLKEKLIPNLPENSILVMDNASYHSMQLDKAPTTATRKADIKIWMQEHGVSFEEDWTKAELLMQLKKHRPEKKYLVDELLREHGHEVLRLPPYNCDLNPFEHVWNLIKQRVADKNVEQHENKIEEFTKEAIASITRDDWKKQVNHIKRVEEEYWNRDVGRERELEDFIISVGMNSDSEDESDDYEDQDCESGQSMEDYNDLMEEIEPIMGSDDQDTAGPSGFIDKNSSIHVKALDTSEEEFATKNECLSIEEVNTSEEDLLDVKLEFIKEEPVVSVVDSEMAVNCSKTECTGTSNYKDNTNMNITSLDTFICGNHFACHCGKEFTEKKQLLTHFETHNQDFKCGVCDRKYTTKSNLKTHMITHSGRRSIVCDVCNKKFSSKSHFTVHTRIHTGEKPYACDQCDSKFIGRNGLISHRKTHTGEKPYACDICESKFSQRSALVLHKRTHTGEKPYNCDLCEMRFPSKSAVVSHRKTHTGEKPYACDICQRKFSRSTHLVLHRRTHTGEKPYACDMCSSRFIGKGGLLMHKRTHAKEIAKSLIANSETCISERPCYICDVCDRKYYYRSQLIVHMRIHTGEKPYACDICNKKFSVNCALTKHKTTHCKDGPFPPSIHACEVCEKKYFYKSELLVHMKTHSRGKSDAFNRFSRNSLTKPKTTHKNDSSIPLPMESSVLQAQTTSGTVSYQNVLVLNPIIKGNLSVSCTQIMTVDGIDQSAGSLVKDESNTSEELVTAKKELVTSEDELVTPKNEQIELVTTKQELVTSEDELVIPKNELVKLVIAKPELVTCEDELVTAKQEFVTSEDNGVTAKQEPDKSGEELIHIEDVFIKKKPVG